MTVTVRPTATALFASAVAVVLVGACSAAPSPIPGSGAVDVTRQYQLPYPDGALPVGDGKFSDTAPAVGTVFACPDYARSLHDAPPQKTVRGPWFSSDGHWWFPDMKVSIPTTEHHDGHYTEHLDGEERSITGNGLPVGVLTGVFPVQPGSLAYTIDPNPNRISPRQGTYDLTADPVPEDSPSCMRSQVGVTTSGVPLFTALDAQGRDAEAWEVQDSCHGHPDPSSAYHYHSGTPCMGSKFDEVIGWALDGYPITGNLVSPGSELSTPDLDVCHGITGPVRIDGKRKDTYHYVATRDFPYTVGCFRAQPATVEPPH